MADASNNTRIRLRLLERVLVIKVNTTSMPQIPLMYSMIFS